MSSFLGIDDSGDPILHFTSDVKTIAQIKGAPTTTTLFHSDLPYVFVRERWRIDSYTNWGSGSGGRKFALPSDLQTFKTNNPNLAFLVIVEESDGSRSIIDPCLNASYYYYRTNSGFLVHDVTTAIAGADYQFAFTDSDTQLSNITRGNTFPSSLTFRLWDTNDTALTIFRSKMGEYSRTTDSFGSFYRGIPDLNNYTWDVNNRTGADLKSSGNDCVAVEIIFLNVTNSPTTFELQPNYSKSSITVSDDQFDVGGLDLLDYAPLTTRGVANNGDIVTPLYGTLMGGTPVGLNGPSAAIKMGFVDSSNQVDLNGTPILEIPDAFTTGDTIEIDFKNKYIKRGGSTVFDANAAASGLRVIGYKEVDFTLATGTFSPNSDSTVTISNTQSGSYSQTPDANTIYLVSSVYAGQDVESSQLAYVGQNKIFNMTYYRRYESGGVISQLYSGAIFFYLDIASDGTITPKCYRRAGRVLGSYPTSFTFPSVKIRLIALSAN